MTKTLDYLIYKISITLIIVFGICGFTSGVVFQNFSMAMLFLIAMVVSFLVGFLGLVWF